MSNGGCSHKRVNIVGGFKCECPDPELSMSSDNKTCHGKYKRIAAFWRSILTLKNNNLNVGNYNSMSESNSNLDRPKKC